MANILRCRNRHVLDWCVNQRLYQRSNFDKIVSWIIWRAPCTRDKRKSSIFTRVWLPLLPYHLPRISLSLLVWHAVLDVTQTLPAFENHHQRATLCSACSSLRHRSLALVSIWPLRVEHGTVWRSRLTLRNFPLCLCLHPLFYGAVWWAGRISLWCEHSFVLCVQ